MSALPPKAGMCGALVHVRFVPIADIVTQFRVSQNFQVLQDSVCDLPVGTETSPATSGANGSGASTRPPTETNVGRFRPWASTHLSNRLRSARFGRCTAWFSEDRNQCVVAAEQPARGLKDAVGDEQCGEHIDRIVIVAEQHDRTEERGQREIEYPPLRDVPEGECREERQTGVAGEE